MFYGTVIFLCFMTGSLLPSSESQDNFYFSIKPSNTDVVEGREAKLRCNVNNRKHIQFSWTMNGAAVRNDSRRFQEDSHLRILRVSRDQDAGLFACIATNVTTGYPIKSPSARLNIQWISPSVAVRKQRSSTAMVHHANLTLKCVSRGNPDPSVQWYRNKITIFPSSKFRLSQDRLRILKATSSDNGVYSCLARNPAGEVDSLNNFILNIRASNAAYLLQDTFKDIYILKRNSPAMLNCKFVNAALTDWYFGDEKLSNNSRTTLYPNGSLALSSVKPRDAGTYKCIGISSNGPAQPFTSQLIVASLQDLTADSFEPRLPESRRLIKAARKRFEISCYPPGGVPAPTQRWEGPTGRAITDQGRIFVENSKLVISDLQEDDSGKYTCVASNLAGETRMNVTLLVSVSPVIVREPSDKIVEEDGVAEFECGYVGSEQPITSIVWLKGQAVLTPSYGSNFKITPGHLSSKLTIRTVRTSDEGRYSCNITTIGQTPVVTTQARLTVRKKLKFVPKPVDTDLDLNTIFTIHCVAEGATTPKVKWIRYGARALPAGVKDDSGKLTFDPVKKSQAGQYTCVAWIDQSSELINITIRVTVGLKPRIQVKPVNTVAYEGHPAILNCVATGDPKPRVNWVKQKSVLRLDSSRMKIFPNGSLYFSEVHKSDIGVYGCIAGNRGGLTRVEATLRVRGKDKNIPKNADSFNPDVPGLFGSMNGSDYNGKEQEEDGLGLTKTVIIAVCSAVAYLALVVSLTICCSIRVARRKKRKAAEEGKKAPNGQVPESQGLLKVKNGEVKQNNHMKEEVRSNVSSNPSQSTHSSRRRESYNSLNFPRHDLQTVAKLGKGMFGDVFLAKAKGIRDEEAETLVVVKSLVSKDDSHHFDFRHEMDMYGKLNHENLVALMGVCREAEPIYIILEYLDWGDLKQFLVATRKDNGRHVKVSALTLAQKVTLCNQIALGMEHLSNNRFVHRDLAARNIMLSSSFNVKVTSLGLSKDIYAAEYYTHHNIAIPLRWMPAESIFEDDYSTKSDVWAYGIFLWEVLTGGDLPYKSRSNEEVLEGIKSGDLRPELLPTWPEHLQSLMVRCWSESPKDRPSFSQIAVDIGQIQVDSDV